MTKGWRNPHKEHLPQDSIYALSKQGKHAHSARRRKEALRRRKQRNRR